MYRNSLNTTPPRSKNHIYGATGRNSNIEFLRMIAMVMVLMLHVNFMSIGEPTTEEAIACPLHTFLRVFFQMSTNIAVNVFVMISGWFGIKFSFKGLFRFVFQCVFIISFMYLAGLVLGLASFEPKQILECLFLENNAWFVKAYIGLFILAPVLNKYCDNSDEREQRIVLLSFFIFQTVFGAFTMSATFIKAGFSTFSFIGLYLLAKYMRRYGYKWIKYALLIFILSELLSVLWFYIPLRIGVMRLAYMGLLYTSPLCITGALGLLLWIASKSERHNKVINFIGESVFAVYLCHACNTWTLDYYVKVSKRIYDNCSGLYYFGTLSTFILLVFIGSILIDQIREIVYNKITVS